MVPVGTLETKRARRGGTERVGCLLWVGL